MSRKLLILFLSFLAFWPAAAIAAETTADPAAQQITTFYAALLDTMKHGPQLGMQGRYKALEPAVDKAFNLPVMMQFIVGPSWSTMSDSDKSLLVSAFRRMTIASYASNFDRYSGERFDVDPNVQQRGSDKLVNTKLVPQSGDATALIYRMRPAGDTWKIIDVFLAGYVSELAMRRSDFASTLASGGAKGLAAKINAIADNSMAGAKNSQ